MKNNRKITELALQLRSQHSLLNLALKCAQPEAARKRQAVVPSRTLEQWVRKLEARAG